MSARHHYLSLYSLFRNTFIDYPGIAKFCLENTESKTDHSKYFIDYQLDRGGAVSINSIQKPDISFANSQNVYLDAMINISKIEKTIYDNLIAISHITIDIPFINFLEDFIHKQSMYMVLIDDYINTLNNIGNNESELLLFDEKIL